MNIRDRIKELRRVRAGDLRPHPKNWRTHPEEQQNALRGILAEVGYVDALMVRELPDGSLQIVDGHLRAETTPDAQVPELVVDLDDKEADKVLATFDPLAAMAEPDEPPLPNRADDPPYFPGWPDVRPRWPRRGPGRGSSRWAADEKDARVWHPGRRRW